ncbi:hypothetical protein B4099_0001 [Heyndrickxia coagulans]|uniref:Uncharacterized protein n=1 Tax=Heyndrickxia coagulans TaxID=1398 RepID=A0A150K8X9_HEYCO|nr:hypothetical protein B4099_0001 [Heyndrickxia coagulans]
MPEKKRMLNAASRGQVNHFPGGRQSRLPHGRENFHTGKA